MEYQDKNISEYKERLEIARQSDDKYVEACMLRNIANIYSTKHEMINYSKACTHFTEAADIFYELQEWYEFYRVNLNLGIIYEKVYREPKQALRIYNNALTLGSADVYGEAQEEREKIIRYMRGLE